MDWKTYAIDHLKDYDIKKTGVQLLDEQIKTLEMEFTSIRSAKTDGDPVRGSNGNRREDMLLTNIALRDELKENREITMRKIDIVEKGLSALTREERRILELFFICRPYNYVSRLCDELNVEQSELYRRKNRALKRFTMAYCGVVEL